LALLTDADLPCQHVAHQPRNLVVGEFRQQLFVAVACVNNTWISMMRGQHEEAIDQAARAQRLNPLDPENSWTEGALAYAHLFQGRCDEAWK
jgi:hypothetical protein